MGLDARGLERALRAGVQGEVRFDDGARALYATDASNYRQIPIGVVVPKTVQDVEETVRLCRRFGAPILSRGAGTSIAGQCCNVAVVLDLSKHLNRVLDVDPQRRTVRVEAGAVLDHVQAAVAPHGLRIGPDPSTHNRCTIGGMVGNNSCGVHSVTAGRMSDNVVALEILTYEGERMAVGATDAEQLADILRQGGRRADIYGRLQRLAQRHEAEIRRRFPRIPRRTSGYNLDDLLPEAGFYVARALTGTEGTCVVVLNATIRLVENPPHKALLVLGYEDVGQAADAVPGLLRTTRPIGLEGVDELLVQYMRLKHLHAESVTALPPGRAWLFLELGAATAADAESAARNAAALIEGRPNGPSVQVLVRP